MRKSMMAMGLAAAGLLLQAQVWAAQEQVIVSETVRNSVEAVVESVDLAQRDLTIRMPDGEKIEFTAVDLGVTHFDQVKINDKINVSGSEAIAIVLSKGTAGVRRVVVSEGRDVTADGVGVLRKRETYHDVIAIDYDKGLARVKNAEGQVVELEVPNKALLAQASVGDQLIVAARATLRVWAKGQ
jgi:hypothetical protein